MTCYIFRKLLQMNTEVSWRILVLCWKLRIAWSFKARLKLLPQWHQKKDVLFLMNLVGTYTTAAALMHVTSAACYIVV